MSRIPGSRGGGGGSMVTEPFDLTRFIDSVASRFEFERRTPVTDHARQALIAQAEGHEAHVEEELTEGRVTIDMLAGYLMTLLDQARGIAERSGQAEITDRAVRQAMRDNCPYFPWC